MMKHGPSKLTFLIGFYLTCSETDFCIFSFYILPMHCLISLPNEWSGFAWVSEIVYSQQNNLLKHKFEIQWLVSYVCFAIRHAHAHGKTIAIIYILSPFWKSSSVKCMVRCAWYLHTSSLGNYISIRWDIHTVINSYFNSYLELYVVLTEHFFISTNGPYRCLHAEKIRKIYLTD